MKWVRSESPNPLHTSALRSSSRNSLVLSKYIRDAVESRSINPTPVSRSLSRSSQALQRAEDANQLNRLNCLRSYSRCLFERAPLVEHAANTSRRIELQLLVEGRMEEGIWFT